MRSLTCKEFLSELSDYLDETTKAEVRGKLEKHLAECPNCWVVCDTTRKTIQVYKGMQSCSIPEDVHSRLMDAVERKIAAKRQRTVS
jgi:anti-sigma factor RsiW